MEFRVAGRRDTLTISKICHACICCIHLRFCPYFLEYGRRSAFPILSEIALAGRILRDTNCKCLSAPIHNYRIIGTRLRNFGNISSRLGCVVLLLLIDVVVNVVGGDGAVVGEREGERGKKREGKRERESERRKEVKTKQIKKKPKKRRRSAKSLNIRRFRNLQGPEEFKAFSAESLQNLKGPRQKTLSRGRTIERFKKKSNRTNDE